MRLRKLTLLAGALGSGLLLISAAATANSTAGKSTSSNSRALTAASALRQQTIAGSGWRIESPSRPGKLESGDVIRITLFGLFSPGNHDTFELHVAEDGTIGVPLLGPVQVKGLTTDRAAAAVSLAQAKANLQQDAIVVIGIVRTAAETRVKPAPIANAENLRITLFDITGPNDRLEILAQTADDGTVLLPMVGPVKLTGLTEFQADEAVKKLFRDKNIIENATVSVLRLDANGQP